MQNKFKIKMAVAIFVSLSALSNSAHAFDIMGFFHSFFETAGSKAVDDTDGIDVDQFQKPGACQVDYPWGPPVTKDKEILKRALYVCRNAYAVQIDPKTKVPSWTEEVLKKENLLMPIEAQTQYFKQDPEIPKKMQSFPDDFHNSGYGHLSMAPALDMVLHNGGLEEEQLKALNKKAMEEAFYMTNQAPIRESLVSPNGLWTQLEQQARVWAVQKNQIFVITGPIYLGGQTKGFLGKSQIAIPTHYFKIITYPLTYGSVAYIIPNKDILSAGVQIKNSQDVYTCNNGPCTLDDFVVPIKEVERLTGFETYSKLAPQYAVRVKQDINELFKKKK